MVVEDQEVDQEAAVVAASSRAEALHARPRLPGLLPKRPDSLLPWLSSLRLEVCSEVVVS